MKSWIRKLPEGAEVALMVTITFGLFVASSTLAAASHEWRNLTLNSADAWELVIVECVVGGTGLSLLRLRGKQVRQYGCKVSIYLTSIGVSLFLVTYLLYCTLYATLTVIGLADGQAPDQGRMGVEVGLLPAIAVILVNPVFEEFFAGAYLIETLDRQWGPFAALAGTIALRASYHTYQGQPGLIMSLAVGLAFGWAYLRWRQLWPLVLAHGLLDGIALILYRTA